MPNSDLRKNSYKYGSSGCWKGPVAYTAPGILTGWSITFSAYLSGGGGREDVYDFGTMERRVFNTLSVGVSDGGGASFMGYMGVVMGLNNVDDLGSIYEGDSYYFSGGTAASTLVPMVPSPEFGIGVMGTQSTTNPEVQTRALYFAGNASIGDIIPFFDFSGGLTNAVPSDLGKTYATNGKVDRNSLMNDLTTVIALPSSLSIYFSILDRMSGPMLNPIKQLVLKYANIHDEIYVNSQ